MKTSLCAACMILLLAGAAKAGDVTILVVDQHGNPTQDAVIQLMLEEGSTTSTPIQHLESSRLVDQRDETFIPFVTLIPQHGQVSFANTDAPLHQVYSFSPIKLFELTLEPGEVSPGIRFDEVGVAAIGCNIHDHMIAYVYVTESPWAAVADGNGEANFVDVSAGTYTLEIWHPRLPPAEDRPRAQLTVGADAARLALNITLLPDRRARRMHSGRY